MDWWKKNKDRNVKSNLLVSVNLYDLPIADHRNTLKKKTLKHFLPSWYTLFGPEKKICSVLINLVELESK